ncbi:MAG: Flp pilus assembly complex ATPase component TadA [Candidatus Omnitrophica bacterium]|nr:Flp pilus assembly complex ATPase component TadA [Candidatus Omnitrophota bacterium]MBU1996018.1 Flp pilus assembly complex ATPase component TadA [Candidatus Omnitrophota bacterium]MBU4334367.1 Flp pilus assembly complex ATPase component TadA [Candidatus Omnitrophota bacterium]
MASFKDRLKEILIRDELITAKELEKALLEQKRAGGELSKILVEMNFVSQDQLTQVLSESLELPLIKIVSFNISPDVIQTIPKDIAIKYQIIPVSLLGDQLTLAMADPLNIFIIDNVKALTGYTIIPIICRVSDIHNAIEKYYFKQEDGQDRESPEQEKNSETFDEIIQDFRDTEDLELIKDGHSDGQSSVEEISDEAPIIKLTDTIIQQAVFAKASDVFIEPLEKAVRIRYRIDGVIREIDRMTKVLHFPLVSRIKVISNLDISEHRLPQDGRFKTIISGDREVDFRVNVLPTAVGEKIVLRVLDQQGTVLDVENLGFEETALQRLKECSVKPHGLILTCGPTGSGKTTTLYSILKYVDSPEKNIVTVEDPVEYQMKGIIQVNIKPKMGLTFSSSLRSILRQDPDIIMIGEIRDKETLDIAVKAALTGHLVLSSLHTTTAAGSIVRMMNMGIEPFLICSSVLAIIAQRLLRRVCPKCCESYIVTPEITSKVGLDKLYPKQNIEVMRPKGCKHCFNTGYKGRVGITEILVFSQKVKEAVLARVGEIKIKQIARQEGMRTMREDGLVKAVEGLTTIEEVLRLTAPDEDKKK